ncbi:hypothetical protein BDV25DRAFT_146347 [Aspergillus avenaceus]|uniref:Uncharacterized protein n=1 Tax=Aspergillus avenaceus TaxID=36643 RepID=A0A5N6U9C8_ASPAV|nr:hypothetical protein BDV25DRAFT_146347 [Aspergillus avenaceus]
MQTFTSESLQHRIRFLIHRQHDHERQWYEGREALLTKQKGRAEKKRELDAVLRSVGAPVEEGDVSTVEEDQAELRKYDMKVYQASRQMSDALVSELKALQIPFFSIRASLVDSKDGISKEELGTLRKRMLEVLMDLCR